MCIQDMICWCCGVAVVGLVATFATFGDEPAALATPAKVELLLTGDDSEVAEAGHHLIAGKEEWTALWARHLGPESIDPETGEVSPAAPEVDFDTQLIVAVFIGRGSTSYGLKLVSYTSEGDELSIRYLNRSYQTTVSSRLDSEEAKLEWEERYGHVSAYGFFLLPRDVREIVLFQDSRGMGQTVPKWTERARFTPPGMEPAER
jgi:hypothetical protein